LIPAFVIVAIFGAAFLATHILVLREPRWLIRLVVFLVVRSWQYPESSKINSRKRDKEVVK